MVRPFRVLIGAALVLAGCGLTSTVDEIPLNEAELGEGVLDAVNALVPDGNPIEFEEIIADDDGKIAIAIAPDLWRITTSGVGVEIEPLPGGGADVETVFKMGRLYVQQRVQPVRRRSRRDGSQR